ncbi:MAG: (d)CMP kinase, partial [Phycisphaerales bacterium]|nr:(d)CMP kinase [Phycisphaerales bacterium]
LADQGVSEDPDATRRSMAERDRQDRSRAHAPLTVPDGAVVLDATDLGPDAVLERVSALVAAALAEE